MDLKMIVIATLTSTSVMTLFSYLVSNFRGRNFKEPKLLNELISGRSASKSRWLGWVIHYFIGLFFICVYELLWQYPGLGRQLFWGVLFGIAIGIIGVCGWTLFIGLHPDPPEVEMKPFFIHLILAHVLFSLTAVLTYQGFEAMGNEN